MRTRFEKLAHFIVGALLLPLCLVPAIAHAQAPDIVAEVAARINRERISRGLAPYALNAQLSQAAQSQADDMAGTGNYSHTGSDGSTVFDRVARTAFGGYSWGRRLGENWAWYSNAATAVSMWMDSAPHRGNILHSLYREIGVGVAPSRGNTIFVIDFGVEPNVLPVFIDGIDGETHTQAVTLTLTSEDVMPSGDGPKTIGRPTQIQLSNSADFGGARWQSFAGQVPWTLSPGGGLKTVYVKYRDATGRTATASDSIVFIATATPRPTSTLTRLPSQLAPPRPTQSPSTQPLPTFTQTALSVDKATPTPVDTATFETTPAETAATATPTPDPPTPTLTPAVAVFAAGAVQETDPVMLGGFGIAIMLITFAFVKYLATRTKV